MYCLLCQQDGMNLMFGDAMDMFTRDNFPQLRSVIDIYTLNEDACIKPGLKQNLYYLLKRASKTLREILLSERRDDIAALRQQFLDLLELWDDIIFGDAVHETNKRREVYLRKPEQLPDMKMVQNHIIERMSQLTENKFEFFLAIEFVELRDVALSRLIIINGRIDGLKIADWQMTKENTWIDKQRVQSLDDLDKLLMSSLKVTYITGKRNKHLVSLLIPEAINFYLPVH